MSDDDSMKCKCKSNALSGGSNFFLLPRLGEAGWGLKRQMECAGIAYIYSTKGLSGDKRLAGTDQEICVSRGERSQNPVTRNQQPVADY